MITDGERPRFTSTTEEAPQASTPVGGGDGARAAGPASVRHYDVICDSCENEIFGYRYKCLQCRDFDLCMHCEAKLIHQEHAMIRIPDSNEIVSI